jgi:hypothetical protein
VNVPFPMPDTPPPGQPPDPPGRLTLRSERPPVWHDDGDHGVPVRVLIAATVVGAALWAAIAIATIRIRYS